MPDCDACGDALDPDRDKAGGRYRDRCLPCIRAAVDAVPHVRSCEVDDCRVCLDHREDEGTQVPTDPAAGKRQSGLGRW